jgi:predicted secreted Zn-dependent protease
MTTPKTGTMQELPPAVQKLIRNLREEVKDHKRMRGDAVREMHTLRREAAKHRVARNAARAELSAALAELEAGRDA